MNETTPGVSSRAGSPARRDGAATGGTVQPETSADRVLERVGVEDIDLVRFLYVDHGGVVRGKAAARSSLATRIHTGIGHTRAMQAMNALDDLQRVEGLTPVGEVRLVPDPATFVPLPYAPGAASMMADLIRLDGQPWEACPRTFLKGAVTDLAAAGYALQAAFEPEFTLGYRQAGADGLDHLVPIDDSRCYSSTGFDLAHDYALALVRALEEQGLSVQHYYPELGHGQQEVSIRHADALRAADNHVTYRETVRGLAWRQDLWASLAPKPIPDQAGNGAHLHLSLWDADANGAAREHNLLHDPSDEQGLSVTGYHFVGGLLAHLPALLAFTCGSVNSYRRLAPMCWSSAYTCYGPDNREAAVRVCSPFWGEEQETANIEFKPSDSAGNPYLALGACLYAGLDGIRRGLDPGAALEVDPATLPAAERERRGIQRLPETLPEALDALERDAVLMEALGSLRSTAYLTVKRSEAAAFAQRDTAYECFQHFATF